MLQNYQHFCIHADCMMASDIIVTNTVEFVFMNFILDMSVDASCNTKHPLKFVMVENGRCSKVGSLVEWMFWHAHLHT